MFASVGYAMLSMKWDCPDTYVLFTSDNGVADQNKAHADGHHLADHGGSAGPLRAGKVSTFEGEVRVPTILWGPGSFPEGTVCDSIASAGCVAYCWIDDVPAVESVAAARGGSGVMSTIALMLPESPGPPLVSNSSRHSCRPGSSCPV